MEFMGTRCQARHPKRMEMDRDATNRLYSVGMNRDSPNNRQPSELLHWLDRSGFVIRKHERR